MYQYYGTKKYSDGSDTSVSEDQPPPKPPESVSNGASSYVLGFSSGQSTNWDGYTGTDTNVTRTQDTLTCSVPGAGSSQVTEIPMKLCYHYRTVATGDVNATYLDGTVSLSSGHSPGGDAVNWDTTNGFHINHGSEPNLIFDKCNTGKLKIVGPAAIFYVSLNPVLAGTGYKTTPSSQFQRQGTLDTEFAITSMPSGVTCTSASKVFPGADGPTREQLGLETVSDASDSEDKDEEAEEEELARDETPDEKTKSNDGSESGQSSPGSAKKVGDASGGGASSQADAGEECGGAASAQVGQPLNFAQGFKVQHEVDYTGASGLNFVRTYRSNGDWLTYRLGARWRHNFDRTLTISGSPQVAVFTNENGVVRRYQQQSDGSWRPFDFSDKTKFESLFDSTPTLIGYAATLPDNTREVYDTAFKLKRIEYTGSYAVDLAYDGSGRLSTVTDRHGRTMTLAYDGSSRVSTLTTPDGVYTYTYGSNNNLIEVEKPDTTTREYHYEDMSFVNALTGITDERGIRVLTWDYDAAGKAIESEIAGSVGDYTVAYNSDGTATVTNPLGKQTIYAFETFNNVPKITKVDGQPSTNCAAAAKDYTYTAEGWVSTKTDWEGHVTSFAYDSRGLPTSMTQAVGTAQERTITTSWDSTFRLPNVTTLGTLTIDRDYDAYGRLTTLTATDTATSETRIWAYDYYSNTTVSGNLVLGRLKEIDGPRTDVTDKTTFTYDANLNLTKVKNALNQETEITARDAAGRPTTVEGLNDVETDLTYDSNGRLETVTVAPGTALEAVTTMTYNDTGDVTGIELPNGTTLTYIYSNARRLTGMADSLGNSATYTRDAAGNITQTDYEDSGSTLRYTHSRTFDELSRLLTSVGASAGWSRSWAWDKNGNVTEYTDGNANDTEYAYDGLQRLKDSTDALSGVTELTTNSLNQTTVVKDPRNNSTSYTYNAFGDVTQIVSPDTGTTSLVVDKAGNVTQRTDARSVVTNYTYDALNRLATVAYPSDSSLNVTLTYDNNPTPGACGTSIGRLCRVVDASGTTDYKYNDLGQLIEVKEVRGALTFATAYEYDLAGVLTKITLPSGREVDYSLNANGQVSGVAADVNGSAVTLASSITYLPFGPMTGLTYGNSKTLSASYDQDYRPTNRSVSGVFSHVYHTDDEGNIIEKGVRTYDYDALNRLDGENDGSTATSFTYDAIGNRLTETIGSTTTYSYPSTSSKLSTVGAASYTYDSAGNITDDDALDYTWSAAGLLKEVKISGSSTVLGTYTYSANHQRTKKVAGGNTVHYVYGLGGRLYGEYDASGALIREYVYLNGAPLAQVDAGSPEVLTYLHTDHLATPRYGTDAGGSTVWTWDSGAFGKEAATGTATVNLRFPGQHYDAETGLHYNWNRYYNPATGRYVSSDPIGLAGGLNTYSYVSASPVMFNDPEGKEPGGPFEGAEPPPNTGGPWTWHPDPNNDRGGNWRDSSGKSASWDPEGHWDIDDGLGNRQRYDRWGTEISASQAHNPPRPSSTIKPIKNIANILGKTCKMIGPAGDVIETILTIERMREATDKGLPAYCGLPHVKCGIGRIGDTDDLGPA